MVDNHRTVKESIAKLKKEKNAIILAHYYTVGDVQDVADFVGDSLALSQKAADCQADIIVFAGVHFMAETAKILSPGKKVIIPDLEAGCSLAESCPADEFREFVAAHPGHTVISYVNTSAAVKALTDICCTSSNAVKVVESLPKGTPIIFGPDRNLGSYIKKVTDRPEIILWDGACHVHEEFSVEAIVELKKAHPRAKVLAHPECKAPVLILADEIGSTAALLDYATKSPAQEFIVATEPGILHKMKADNPGKLFIPVPGNDATCGCNDCRYMKLMTLEKIERSLKEEAPEVTVDPETAKKAITSIQAMLKI